MTMPSGKKILLIVFILILLIAIPITVYLAGQQQKTQSGAVAASTLSLTPASQTTTVGSTIGFDINVDPSTNLISFVKVIITYDATKLAVDSTGFVPNKAAFPSILQTPTYTPGTISVTLSIGGSPQNAIQKPTKVGTISFRAIAPTDNAPTQITFGNQTQVLSLGSTDQFNENVLSTTNPATVNILASSGQTPTPTETPTPTATPTPTPTDTPTDTPTVSPTDTLTATDTPTPTQTPTPSTTQVATAGPVCSSLTLDRSATGEAPYSVNFTLTGSSSNSTISKVTFNFGDGQTLDVNSSGGIGTNSVNILQSHVYATAGTFTATAVLTDAANAVSSGGCSIVITATAPGASPTIIAQAPSPLPSTGPSGIITIGALGAILAIVGALLLFAL